MRIHPLSLSRDIVVLDSFFFARKKFFSKPGTSWTWANFLRDTVVSDLSCQFIADDDGRYYLKLHYLAYGEDGNEKAHDYAIELSVRRWHQTRKWWFSCPSPRTDGYPCERRCQYLFLRRGDERFGCRSCKTIPYESSRRNHNPVYRGYEKPLESVQQATMALLTARTHRRKRELEASINAAQEELKRFYGSWKEVAGRLVTGRARRRDHGQYQELLPQLLDDTERSLITRTSFEPKTPDDSYVLVEWERIVTEFFEGLIELVSVVPLMLLTEASRDPPYPVLMMASIMTTRLRRRCDSPYL